MRFSVLMVLLCLGACSSVPSLPERGFLGQSAWRHQRALEDAAIIMQGMNRARADSARYARQQEK